MPGRVRDTEIGYSTAGNVAHPQERMEEQRIKMIKAGRVRAAGPNSSKPGQVRLDRTSFSLNTMSGKEKNNLYSSVCLD